MANPTTSPGHRVWTAAEKEALNVLQASVDADKEGAIAKLAPLYHERFMGWSLATPTPLGRDEFLREEETLLRTASFPRFDIQPLSVEVVDRTAVVNVTYSYLMVQKDGKKLEKAGRWMAMLVKEAERWLYLGCAYIDTK